MMLGYPTAKRSVTRLLLASMLIAVMILGTLILPSSAATQWTLQGFGLGQSKDIWTTGNVKGYYEGDFVPHRLIALNFERTGQPIIVYEDNLLDDVMGFDGACNFFIGPAVGNDVPLEDVTEANYPGLIIMPSMTTFMVEGPDFAYDSSGNTRMLQYTLNPNPSNDESIMSAFLERLETEYSDYGDGWAMYWYAHMSVTTETQRGASYWTGSSLHTHVDRSSMDLPISVPPKMATEVETEFDSLIPGDEVLVGNLVVDNAKVFFYQPLKSNATPTGSVELWIVEPGGDPNDVSDWIKVDTKPVPIDYVSGTKIPFTAQQLNEVGDYYFKAVYVPDSASKYTGNESGPMDEHLISIKRDTALSTMLSVGNVGAEEVLVGDSITDDITLTWTAPAGFIPSGNVLLYVKEPGATEWALEETLAISASAASPYTLTSAPIQLDKVGTYYFKATYAGDANFNPSASGETDEMAVVVKRDTSISTLLSVGNTGDPAVLVGTKITDAISLTWDAPAGYVPSGTINVTMKDPDGIDSLVCAHTISGAVASPYQFTTPEIELTKVGDYFFKAEYVGDINFNGSVSLFEDEKATTYMPLCEETIWAKLVGTDPAAIGFSGTGNWGWYAGPLPEGDYEFELWAGAAFNDTSKGTFVGMLYMTYDSGCVTFTLDMEEGFAKPTFSHVYISETAGVPSFPEDFTKDTLAEDELCGFTEDIFFAYHSVVMMPCDD